ncbi:hypothetical protein O6H91_08G042000 [Diphasiastrum complanatum]|uniref:Uncharacterized protein n=1 Tax=Diphasiastrum complanatum TaxID=34168 RepID=A0ACC2CX99_DIPCM|nr:hypothetical protein O6H91_08G042000 [Diphasiastrum complanatum]
MAGQVEVLVSLDKARTQWYHFMAILVAGMGFFTDAYDLFCISTVTKLLGRLYYYDPLTGKPGSLPPSVNSAVSGVALCGTLAGQLFFGWLGDQMGRKKAYGITLFLMVVCSIASGLSFGSTAKSVMVTLCFFRFWLGFGIGGDYPLSATIMSEYANTKTRGAFIAAVFAMQGVGIVSGATVAILVATAFKKAYPRPAFDVDPILSTPQQADFVWRLVFMLGAIPAALTYYWRMRMPETARYTALVAKNVKQAAEDMAKVLSLENFPSSHAISPAPQSSSPQNEYGILSKAFLRKHGLQLLGTASTWFLLDIAFYSQNLFQKDVLTQVGWLPNAKKMSALEEVFRISRAQALIALCSTVPGYWVTVALVDRIGRIPIQLLGFFFMTVFMFALAIPYYHWRGHEKCPSPNSDMFCGGNHIAFVVLYSFTFFFANFGPNSTTFIIPAELFPARLRSTCHGISAAAGKAGAIIGAFGFLYAAQSKDPTQTDAGYRPGIGIKSALILLAVTNILGLLFTLVVPETNGKSLEDLSKGNATGALNSVFSSKAIMDEV